IKVDEDHTVLIYVLTGTGSFDGTSREIESHRAVKLINGDTVEVKSKEEELRFLLLSAKPLGEPIAWGGPIVMNTREELRTAFNELDEGNFIK
ncbi:MAG: pirin family protein, partial [Spirochaetia bacterium]|nr:pirin family protein [Spirochaetia bacterium]